jgi:F-type H+-transporting ATPase subunit a
MEQPHELWLTKLFNEHLAAPARSILESINGLNIHGVRFENLDKPWDNYITFQILTAILLIVVALIVRSRLSVAKPGAMQNSIEGLYGVLKEQAGDIIHHHSDRYLPYFLTLFFFILACNLIGLIPGFHSPTMDPYVPLGCAILTFVYYHFFGVYENGPSYIKQFIGVPKLGFFLLWIPMFIIELLSHFARPMSLTVRLYANMFVGEAITDAFLGLAPILIPIIFMALHTFVSFLQAYIFTLLSMVYVGMSTEAEH